MAAVRWRSNASRIQPGANLQARRGNEATVFVVATRGEPRDSGGELEVGRPRDEPWELFDLSVDRAENNNLAGELPEKVKQLESKWLAAAEQYKADRGEDGKAK